PPRLSRTVRIYTLSLHDALPISVNNSPMLIEDSYFPVVIAPDLLHQDLDGSLYALLANVYQHKPTAKWEYFLPVAAQVREQQLLKVSAQHPLLKIHRVAYDRSNAAVEYSEDILRCDAAQIMVTTNLHDQQLPRPGQPLLDNGQPSARF